jgi:hypothetical protein
MEFIGGDDLYKDSITQKLIPKEVSECSLIRVTSGGPQGTCLSGDAIKFLSAKAGIDASVHDVISAIRSRYGAKSDKQLLNELPDTLKEENSIFFKVEGPTGTTLLSNDNIDEIMQQWSKHFRDFFPYSFNMLNYTEYSFRRGRVVHERDTLASIDPRELFKKYKCCGCVINSDLYQGQGKHWMALFADNRDPSNATVEFFNSSGRGPAPEWLQWMNRVTRALNDINGREAKIVTNHIIHQKSKTECGVFSLFYIWSRLNGIKAEYFDESKVPDAAMFEMRSHLFDGAKSGTWLFDEFNKNNRVQWEKG